MNEQSDSLRCSACDGCQHRQSEPEVWCYMFRDKPEVLPCGQHDKFAEERKAMGKFLRTNPQILSLMALAHQQPTELTMESST